MRSDQARLVGSFTRSFINKLHFQIRWRWKERRVEMLLMILVIVLLLALFGSLPTWPHSRDWGYYPSGGISLVLLILLILFLMGRL
jgi:hypothetical protein